MTANNPNALGNIPPDGIKVRDCHRCEGNGILYGEPRPLRPDFALPMVIRSHCPDCKGTGQLVEALAGA